MRILRRYFSCSVGLRTISLGFFTGFANGEIFDALYDFCNSCEDSELFSSYKNHTTLKALVGITPGGALSFVSRLYTGRISDREIVLCSGFLDQTFDNGDSVMADKGFTVQDMLPPRVGLNVPPFLGSQSQMSAEDVVKTLSITSLRVHVERAINNKKFSFLGWSCSTKLIRCYKPNVDCVCSTL